MERPEYIKPPEHAKVNQFAIRCFRDTGDADYIAARLAMRARLAIPFLWSAEQAIEKYLKCILMLNRQKTGDLGHNIAKALRRINSRLPFEIRLGEDEQQVFDHVAQCDGDRYLLMSLELEDIELIMLDRLVWRLRQYCEPLDVVHYADEPSEDVLLQNVRRIALGLDGPATNGHIQGALLERVLGDSEHPAHDALVWQNLKFSLSGQEGILFLNNFQAINAPLFLNPELVDVVAKWMHVPDETKKKARRLATLREAERKKQERQARGGKPPS
ncbi:hypothetical protein SAMN05428959_10816 [Duganella sp. CF517]|uniref:hypothetical protein n=1 Tax=Duganella sp. CF517 TaxID=1881038 RepID=UPI0008CFC2A7|nr:hypothetical protein [Duganella sp. CF517]SEO43782.1 hypothetical protein SAMN05428959_10816 [Duganella sp. CF517]